MKTIKEKKSHSSSDQKYHFIQAEKWVPGGVKALTVLRVRTFCAQLIDHEKGAYYGAFEKDKHVAEVCMKCVKSFVAWQRAGKPDLSPAPEPPSVDGLVDVLKVQW